MRKYFLPELNSDQRLNQIRQSDKGDSVIVDDLIGKCYDMDLLKSSERGKTKTAIIKLVKIYLVFIFLV